ncbi:MAG: hypothetical protein ABIP46_06490 [Polaromonas sp.]
MPFIAFNKAFDPAAPDDLRINTAAVLYVEASRPDLIGQTTIHLIGQGTVVNAVTESVGTVVSALMTSPGSLVGCTRHYLAPPPEEGASTVYIATANVSYLRPNNPASPDFWVVRFVDGSELRVMAPLPEGL